MNYSYDKAKAYAQSIGIEWQEKQFENFDQMAAAHGFSQSQVDIAVQNCLVSIASSWDSKVYSLKQRIKIAAKFILGIKGKLK